jgi:hypothetical protein
MLINTFPSYTACVDLKLPLQKFRLERSTAWKQAFQRWLIIHIKDMATNQTHYIAEANFVHNRQLTELKLYRVPEYDYNPCVTVAIASVTPGGQYDTRTGLKGRPIGLTSTSLSGQQIVEQPDRLERAYWGPRRFAYGGRQFVWKPEKKENPYQCENLFEYTKTWPQEGSKTGKQADDAQPHKLAWGDPINGLTFFPITIYMAGGIDLVFKEHILASQCARMACYSQFK